MEVIRKSSERDINEIYQGYPCFGPTEKVVTIVQQHEKGVL